MKKAILFFIFSVLFITSAVAQDRDDAGYLNMRDGIGLYAPDSMYSLILKFRMQNRLGLTSMSESDLHIKEVEARVRRLRLRLEGFAFSPKLVYKIQLAFARGDIDAASGEYPNIVRDAVIFYNINKKISIGFGQTKLPSNRQRVVSSSELQMPDRSIVNSVFTSDRDFGIQLYHANNIGKTAAYNLRGAISNGEGRNIVTSDAGLCYTARAEFLPLGRFTNGGDYFEGDLERETKPKISIGVAYSYNQNTTKTGGQLGERMPKGRDVSLLYADVLFKYNGWAWATEFAQRNCFNPIVYNKSMVQFVYAGNGINSQLSYLFKNKYEIVGKYSITSPAAKIKSLVAQKQQIAVGGSKYLRRHRIKLQSDITYETNTWLLTSVSHSNWMWRFQVELGI